MGILWDFERFAENVTLISDSGVTVKHQDLVTLGDELEQAIEKNGCISNGNKPLTMFVCSNTLGALSGYAALINRGFPMLPASEKLPLRMRRELMNIYRPRLLFIPQEIRNDYKALREICVVRGKAGIIFDSTRWQLLIYLTSVLLTEQSRLYPCNIPMVCLSFMQTFLKVQL